MKLSSLSIILSVALFFVACSDNSTVGTTPLSEDVAAVQFSFKTAPMDHIGSTTRSVGNLLNLGGGNISEVNFSAITTRSTDKTTVDDTKIKDLWVFQYITGGNFVRRQYFSSVDVSDFRMDLSKNIEGEKSSLFFVANVGPNAFPDLLVSEAAFKSYGIKITNEASVLPTTGFLPMYGSLLGLNLPDDFINNSNAVTLTRMVNRVDFSFQLASTGLPSGFLIKSVRLLNVPNKSYPYKDAGATIFPTLNNVTLLNFDYEAITATDQTGSAVPLSFYLPENMRGNGNGTVETDKTGITGATCIQLVGYADGDEITYNIYPGANATANYDLVRNTTYTVSAAITGIYQDDGRVKKTPTANTYIVRPGSSINVPVKRANQTVEIGEQLADITTGWSSAVLWRDNKYLTVITDDVNLQSEGFFTVRVPDLGAEGNAVVYIKDGSDNILWSWHIWVTNYDPVVNNEEHGSYILMNRNLGAINRTKGDLGAFGLFYQWGRKDPFAGASAVANGTNTLKTLYSNGSGTTTYPSTTIAAPTTSVNNLLTAVRNPGTFYKNATDPKDWYPGSSNLQNNALWGGTKTVYDPCPAGWKVAPMAAFDNWSTTTSWDGTNMGRFAGTILGSWYPAMGNYSADTGVLNLVAEYGYLWTSGTSGTGGNALYYGPSGVGSASNNQRGTGFAIRCMKD